MTNSSRLPAVVAYLPVIGWLYVYLFQRRNELAVFHLRQCVGLCLLLIGALVVWVVVGWVLAWIPFLGILSIGLFTLVMAVYFYGVAAWVVGLLHALNKRRVPLPGLGRWASRLPIA